MNIYGCYIRNIIGHYVTKYLAIHTKHQTPNSDIHSFNKNETFVICIYYFVIITVRFFKPYCCYHVVCFPATNTWVYKYKKYRYKICHYSKKSAIESSEIGSSVQQFTLIILSHWLSSLKWRITYLFKICLSLFLKILFWCLK